MHPRFVIVHSGCEIVHSCRKIVHELSNYYLYAIGFNMSSAIQNVTLHDHLKDQNFSPRFARRQIAECRHLTKFYR